VRTASSYNNRFLFTGREYLGAWVYDYRARVYHAYLGRFMSEDPKLFDAGDYNLFRYCHNDPIDFTDPMGLEYQREPWPNHQEQAKAKTLDDAYNEGMANAQRTMHGAHGGATGIGMAGFNTWKAMEGLTMGMTDRGSKGRALTGREVSEAKTVFDDKISYDPVRVINDKYVPWQSSNIAVTPNGNIYYPRAPADFVLAGGAMVQLFIHEMTHVMQYQHGVDVLGKGLLLQTAYYGSLGAYNPYHYNYNPNRAFSSYNIEQQGDIASRIYTRELPNNIDYSDLR
jgi:RHS repeat-associated protein